MKIIHLSDLHVGQGQLHQRFVRLVDHILEQHDPSEHVIAITGDLVDVMDERSFRQVRAQLDRLGAYLVMCVPGNHDVLPLKGVDLGLVGRGDYALWRKYISREPYPQRWRVGDWTIIGLDTNAGTAQDAEVDLAQGCVGPHQLMELTLALADQPALVLGHHRVWWRDKSHLLEDAAQLHEVLDPRASMYLCGHQHQAHVTKRGDVVYIAAPSSTKSMRYQCIDLVSGVVDWVVVKDRIS